MRKLLKHTDKDGVLYIIFYCPACKCCHSIKVYEDSNKGWTWNGDDDKPTFSPSLLVNKNQRNPMAPICHSYVRGGKIEYLNDCTHDFKGNTIDMEEV